MSSFVSDDNLLKAQTMALELANLKQEIENTEYHLKEMKSRLNTLAMREIPQFFDDVAKTDLVGVPQAGVNVRIVPYFHANIKSDWPEEQRDRAFNYLETEGYGSIVSVVVSVSFQRGELDKARALELMLRRSNLGNTNPPKLEMGVPWNTLTALVKEQVTAGNSIDLEILGATVGRMAKIEKRK